MCAARGTGAGRWGYPAHATCAPCRRRCDRPALGAGGGQCGAGARTGGPGRLMLGTVGAAERARDLPRARDRQRRARPLGLHAAAPGPARLGAEHRARAAACGRARVGSHRRDARPTAAPRPRPVPSRRVAGDPRRRPLARRGLGLPAARPHRVAHGQLYTRRADDFPNARGLGDRGLRQGLVLVPVGPRSCGCAEGTAR